MLDYDLIIATRNRAHVLRLSLPLLLSQSRPPARLIVADSSDDHQPVRTTVEELVRGHDLDLDIVHCERGLTRQRNVGLRRAKSPIVMFPDDDALAFPGVAEAIMRVWERDTEGRVGGVCAAWADVPPPSMADQLKTAYKMARRDRVELAISRFRQAAENLMFQDPFIAHGRSRWSVQPEPAWLDEVNAVHVEWMTGLCMSYRRELIRTLGFDETLERYGLFEDVEASFKISQTHLILGANSARLFHYRMPGRRANGVEMGATQVLNRAYITCKHSPSGSRARRLLRRYAGYKLMLYLVGIHGRFGRERVVGAWRALRCIPKLVASPTDELPKTYRSVLEQCTGPSRT